MNSNSQVLSTLDQQLGYFEDDKLAQAVVNCPNAGKMFEVCVHKGNYVEISAFGGEAQINEKLVFSPTDKGYRAVRELVEAFREYSFGEINNEEPIGAKNAMMFWLYENGDVALEFLNYGNPSSEEPCYIKFKNTKSNAGKEFASRRFVSDVKKAIEKDLAAECQAAK